MAKLSKRIKSIREKVDPAKTYTIEEAVTLLGELSSVKFKESVEVAVNLGVDPRKSDQVVRGATVMPNGTGTRYGLYRRHAGKTRTYHAPRSRGHLAARAGR